jgi:SAM-dependent MidA family methyltransferase
MSAAARQLPAEPMPPLGQVLKQRISAEGAISVQDFMHVCLYDAHHGYYRVREPLGRDGDFITSPEISQIFGELIGLWAVETWRAMGAPAQVSLIELGPGRGTLMADTLRASKVAPDFQKACSLHLVETSAPLRAQQKSALESFGLEIRWHDALEQVDPGPAIVIANEFFDALPVQQFVRMDDGWHERCVVLGADDAFAFGIPPATTAPPAGAPTDAKDGDVFELRLDADKVIAQLARRGADHAVSALLIDYGHLASACGDTLQAVRHHERADPLGAPGETDLTAHVDFAALARSACAAGLQVWQPLEQRAFLLSLGLAQRCAQLEAAAGEAGELDIRTAAQRLVDPDQMGTLFKVMAIGSANLPAPPAFEHAWDGDARGGLAAR